MTQPEPTAAPTQTDILLALAWKTSQPDEERFAASEEGGPEFVEMLSQAASILSYEPVDPDEPGYRLAAAVAGFIYAMDDEDDLRDIYDEWQAHTVAAATGDADA